MERVVEMLMYRARWVLAPIYFGLSLAVIALGLKFFQELYHLLAHGLSMTETELILIILALIDMAMVGGLLVMVMLSGYENFVSRLDVESDDDKLHWLGKLDSGTLKSKIMTGIVAISAIHLLKVFMAAEKVPNDKMLWYVIIHMTFVVSTVAIGLLDWKTRKAAA
jgi:uncharacterized protein (TIGR00645 family)